MRVWIIRSMFVTAAAALGVAVGFVGCSGNKPAPQGPQGLCRVDTRQDAGTSSSGSSSSSGGGHFAVRSLRPDQWYALLLSGYDQNSHRVSAPERDCTGAAVEWHDPTVRCAEPPPQADLLPTRALTEDDVIIGRVDATKRLVWAVTERYTNGEGIGPVALAEFTDDGVVIRTIGTLRAMPRRARLHFETVGDHQKILVAEGEACGNEQDPSTCSRTIRLMTQQGDHFVAEPLTNENGDCIAPARFEMSKESTATLDNGWTRRFTLNQSLGYGPDGIIVHEQVVVTDSDPRVRAEPARAFRRVEGSRRIVLNDGHLEVQGASAANQLSLWTRMMEGRASLMPDATAQSTPPASGTTPTQPPQQQQ